MIKVRKINLFIVTREGRVILNAEDIGGKPIFIQYINSEFNIIYNGKFFKSIKKTLSSVSLQDISRELSQYINFTGVSYGASRL